MMEEGRFEVGEQVSSCTLHRISYDQTNRPTRVFWRTGDRVCDIISDVWANVFEQIKRIPALIVAA
jgi:hypothetical protein